MMTTKVFQRVSAIFLVVAAIFLANCVAYAYMDDYYKSEVTKYTLAIQNNPNDYDAYIQRGLTYMTLAKYNKAFKDFNSAVAYSERAKKKYFDFLERRGEPKRFPALSESRLAEAYLGRGACYFILGDRKKAVQDYTKSIQSYNSIQNDMFAQVFEYKEKLAQAYYGRGMAYQALGENAKAQADLAKAKQLASNG